MSPPKVAICTPYYDQVKAETASCMFLLAAHSAMTVAMAPITCNGAYTEDNRNGCVEAALKTEIPFDWLLWIDTDMVFPPDALTRLIAHDKDIVGANYRQRKPPYGFTAHYLDGSDTHLLEPGLWPMSHVATGLLLTRFDIYRKLPYPWFNATSDRTQPRDEVYFCREAREAGYEIWCDHDLTFQVGHIGEQVVPWFSKEQLKPVETIGAQLNHKKNEAMAAENFAESNRQYREWERGQEAAE